MKGIKAVVYCVAFLAAAEPAFAIRPPEGSISELSGLQLDPVPQVPSRSETPSIAIDAAPGLPLVGTFFREADLERQLRVYLRDHAQDFGGITAADFRLDYVQRIPGTRGVGDMVYARFTQSPGGVDVEGAYITFAVKLLAQGMRIASIGGRVFPQAPRPAAGLFAQGAIESRVRTRLRGRGAGARLRDRGRRMRFLQGRWRITRDYDVTDLGLRAAVDEATGETFAWDDRRYFDVTGNVSGRGVLFDPLATGGNLPTLPLADLKVDLAGGFSGFTDAQGNFNVAYTLSAPVASTASLQGRWASVVDEAGSPITFSGALTPGTPADILLNAGGNAEGQTAQVNAYYHTTKAYHWLTQRGVSPPGINRAILAYVNRDGFCNAFATGSSIVFYKSSNGCANTAYDTVIYHEYGHIVDGAIGGITSTSLSEGWGDLLAAYITGQPLIGENFYLGSTPNSLRTADNPNTFSYLADSYGGLFDYSLGGSWAGFAWDLRKNLIASQGAEAGVALAENLVIPTLWANSMDIPQAVRAVAVRDDDDGNIFNGTAHFNEIKAAADRHGLGFILVPDVTPPTVSITTPAANAVLTGLATISATASDSRGTSYVAASRVDFYLDGGTDFLKSDPYPPFDLILNAVSLSTGAHTLTAKAFDESGNSAEHTINVTVVGDITPPSVSITTPADNASSEGTISIAAAASDIGGIAKVEFYRDGTVPLGTDTSSPYGSVFYVTSASTGAHTLTAKAFDTSGNSAEHTINITVLPDATPPSVSIAAPADNASIEGSISVVADASDNNQVVRIEFYRDGNVPLGARTSFPYNVPFNAATVSAGAHTLSAKAFDQAGNSSSRTINVTVIGDTTPPSVFITTPTDNASLTGTSTVTITATAGDPSGISRVEFYLDGNVSLGSDITSPYNASFYAGSLSSGAHTLSAKAFDQAGNSAAHTINFTVVPDTTPPSVSITTPAGNASITGVGTVTVAAAAVDDVGVVRVELYRDGSVLLASRTLPPYSATFNAAAVSAGAHTLSAKAFDQAGNSAEHAIDITIVPDTTPPSVFITTPAENASLTGLVTITATAADASGINRVEFYSDGTVSLGSDASLPYSATFNTASLSTGAHTLSAKAFDQKGNSSTHMINVTVLPDITPPSVAITTPADNASFTGTVTVTITATAADASGINRVELYRDGSVLLASRTLPPYSATFSASAVSTGTHTLSAKAFDQAGNTATHTINIAVLPDSTPPSVFITTPADNASFTGTSTVTITATAGDPSGISRVEFYRDGDVSLGSDIASPYNASFYTGSLSSGAHALTARAFDQKGNSAAHTINFTVVPDITPPSVAITAPAGGAVFTGTVAVTIAATAADAVGVVRVEFYRDGAVPLGSDASSPYNASFNTGSLSTGTHTLSAKAFDQAGNTAAHTINFTVLRDTTPPSVAITTPAAGAVLTGSLMIRATALDNVGVSRVDFYRDGTVFLGSDDASPYLYTWNTITASEGAHPITAKAIDAAGNAATSAAVDITVKNTPTAVFTFPAQSATVWGIVNLAAAITEATATKVEFYRDGFVLLGVDEAAPFGMPWNTTLVSDGPHMLTVKAYNGSLSSLHSITVHVYNRGVSPTVSNIAAFPFSEGAGSATVGTGSGGSSTGTISGAAWTDSGKFGKALNFDGLDDKVTVPAASSFAFTTHFTVSAWVNPSSSGGVWRTVLAKQGTASGGPLAYTLYGKTPAGGPGIFINSSASATTTTPISTNTWTHLAGTYDGATLRLYVNGNLVASRATTTPAAVSAGPLVIGANLTSGDYYRGRIDEANLYHRALNAAEIQATMNGETPTDTTPPTVSITSPADGALVLGVVDLFANASDNAGVSGVQYKLDGVNLGPERTISPSFSYSWDTRGVPDGTHILTAVARDAAGNRTTSSGVLVTVNNAMILPAPTNLTAVAVSASKIRLNWTDNVVGVVHCINLERAIQNSSFEDRGTICTGLLGSNTTYLDSGLVTGYQYSYRVRSVAYSVASSYSNVAQATPSLTLDTAAPILSGVTAGGITPDGADITWLTNENSDTVVEFGLTTVYTSTVSAGGGLITNHFVRLNNLTPGTLYHYRARSKDAAGNQAVSADYTFTTPAAAVAAFAAAFPGSVALIDRAGAAGSASGGVLGRPQTEKPKALVLSAASGGGKALAFAADVREASIVTLRGQTLANVSRTGGPIVLSLEGDLAPRNLESGMLLIIIKRDDGKPQGVPLLVVR